MAYYPGSFEQEFMDPFGSRTTTTNTTTYEMTQPDQPPWYSLFYTTDMMKKPTLPQPAAPPAVKAAVADQQNGSQTQTANAETSNQANVEAFRGGHRFSEMQHYQMMQMQSMNNTINMLIMFLFLVIIICTGIIFVMLRRKGESSPINLIQPPAGTPGISIQQPSI